MKLKNSNCDKTQLKLKNPAYGRQSISRPMRIVAPMPQEGGPRIPQNPIFLKNGKNHPNAKTQKSLEICQSQRYALRPEVSNPSGSVVSGQTKNTQKPDFFENGKNYPKCIGKRGFHHVLQGKISKKKNFFCAAIFDNFQTKMFKSETTSLHYFSPRILNL